MHRVRGVTGDPSLLCHIRTSTQWDGRPREPFVVGSPMVWGARTLCSMERPDCMVVHWFLSLTGATRASVPGQALLEALSLWREKPGPIPGGLVGQLPRARPSSSKGTYCLDCPVGASRGRSNRKQDAKCVPGVQVQEEHQTLPYVYKKLPLTRRNAGSLRQPGS